MLGLLAIGSPKHNLPHYSSTQFETLSTYQRIAKRIIASDIYSQNPALAIIILQSEEYLSYIETALMCADWKWDGRGTRHGFRKQYIKWVVKSLVTKHKNMHYTQSLEEIDDMLLKTLPDTRIKTPVDIAQHNELNNIVNKIIHSANLTEKQSQCIKLRYVDEFTFDKIGQILETSKQDAKQTVEKALAKLNKKAKNNEYG